MRTPALARSTTRALAPLLVLVALGARDARAIDPRGFDPPASGATVLGLDTTRLGPAWRPFASAYVSLGDDELAATGGASSRLVLHLAAGAVLVDLLELGVGVRHQASEPSGWGDLHLAVKARLTPSDAWLGLALALTAGVPLGDAATAEDGLTLDPRLVVDVRGDDVIAALSLGYRHRPEGRLGDLDLGGELRFGAGIEGRLHGPLTLVGELEGGHAFSAATRATPLEARLGARLRAGELVLTVAGGARLTDGYGVPDARLVVQLAWAPAPLGPEAAAARAIRPATPLPEPPPPDLTLVRAEDPDGDADGISLPYDQCPDAPEDRDGVADSDGCPDAEPLPPADPGYQLTSDGRLVLPSPIEFRSGSDVLLPEAAAVIEQIARFLAAHPEVKRLRIEGHTDDQGDEEENVDLSERRAASVRRALVARGVDAQRLLPKGYGKTRPITDNVDAASRKQNRRVELRVVPLDAPPDARGGARSGGGGR